MCVQAQKKQKFKIEKHGLFFFSTVSSSFEKTWVLSIAGVELATALTCRIVSKLNDIPFHSVNSPFCEHCKNDNKSELGDGGDRELGFLSSETRRFSIGSCALVRRAIDAARRCLVRTVRRRRPSGMKSTSLTAVRILFVLTWTNLVAKLVAGMCG